MAEMPLVFWGVPSEAMFMVQGVFDVAAFAASGKRNWFLFGKCISSMVKGGWREIDDQVATSVRNCHILFLRWYKCYYGNDQYIRPLGYCHWNSRRYWVNALRSVVSNFEQTRNCRLIPTHISCTSAYGLFSCHSMRPFHSCVQVIRPQYRR